MPAEIWMRRQVLKLGVDLRVHHVENVTDAPGDAAPAVVPGRGFFRRQPLDCVVEVAPGFIKEQDKPVRHSQSNINLNLIIELSRDAAASSCPREKFRSAMLPRP